MGVNKVILIGNLGGAPELRYTQSGIPMVKFSIATSERRGKDENDKPRPPHTEWHHIVVWRGLAEICAAYLRKGSKVYLEGKIRSSEYIDSTTVKGIDIKRYFTEIICDTLEILTPKDQNQEDQSQDTNPEIIDCKPTQVPESGPKSVSEVPKSKRTKKS